MDNNDNTILLNLIYTLYGLYEATVTDLGILDRVGKAAHEQPIEYEQVHRYIKMRSVTIRDLFHTTKNALNELRVGKDGLLNVAAAQLKEAVESASIYEPNAYIYCIENKINGKKYIGQTTRSCEIRWRQHRKELSRNRHHSSKLQSDWQEYGTSAFKFYIVEETHSVFVDRREQYHIDLLDTIKQGYNMR